MTDRLSATNLDLVAASRVEGAGADWAMARRKAGLALAIGATRRRRRILDDFEGETSSPAAGTVLVGPVSPGTRPRSGATSSGSDPRPLGTRTSAGLGDRLGLATPGHVRAVRAVGGFAAIAPIFPQQSIREMTRTGRSPIEVMDDATWGIFAEGWKDGTGADADHLKTTADIDACLAVGFSLFTIDPGEHVDSAADSRGRRHPARPRGGPCPGTTSPTPRTRCGAATSASPSSSSTSRSPSTRRRSCGPR